MLSIDRVWARQGQRTGRGLDAYTFRAQTHVVTLAPAASSPNQAVNFAAGAIICGISAACVKLGSVATLANTRPGLDLFSVAIQDQANSRWLVGSAEAIGSAVFGRNGDLLPMLEITMSNNSSLLYSVTSLVATDTLVITFVHHCLVRTAV